MSGSKSVAARRPGTSEAVTSRHLRRDKDSMNTHEPPELTEETQTVATYISMVVRNAMEDFHCEHLSDGQMKELNPIIRNAIGTALHTVAPWDTSVTCVGFTPTQVTACRLRAQV